MVCSGEDTTEREILELCSEGSGPLARPTQTRHPPSVIAQRKSSATPFAACPVHLFFFCAVRTSRSARIASGMRCFARNSRVIRFINKYFYKSNCCAVKSEIQYNKKLTKFDFVMDIDHRNLNWKRRACRKRSTTWRVCASF